uniref:Uncharacterized protein n=1 Tax=Pyxicephalus adspersus TaxID=30357 RepID=A0AAV3ADY4_PYXAD|nr:TPA: hypothetical protein GDO54_018094 [Pyxicephalus adspersus]
MVKEIARAYFRNVGPLKVTAEDRSLTSLLRSKIGLWLLLTIHKFMKRLCQQLGQLRLKKLIEGQQSSHTSESLPVQKLQNSIITMHTEGIKLHRWLQEFVKVMET